MKPYCKNCVYHLPFVDRVKRDGKGDFDICGHTLETFTDDIGRTKFRTHGDIQHCDECGQVTQDNRKVAYQKCEIKNKKLKCEDFSPKWYFRLFFFGRKKHADKK